MKEKVSGSFIVMGKFARPFGIRGFLHLHSFTEDPIAILEYKPWYIGSKAEQADLEIVEIAEVKQQGNGLIVRPLGCEDRDTAITFTNCEIYIEREALPKLPTGEFYWADLVGLEVITVLGIKLGVITEIFETGSNDVLIVQGEKREYLIPYIPDTYIKEIDLKSKQMKVDWDPEF